MCGYSGSKWHRASLLWDYYTITVTMQQVYHRLTPNGRAPPSRKHRLTPNGRSYRAKQKALTKGICLSKCWAISGQRIQAKMYTPPKHAMLDPNIHTT